MIGRINSLMVTIDMEAKQRHERVEDFEQYAKQRKLPDALRQRAMQSLAYKSECLLELKVGDVFKDLPIALRCQLFYEMYGSFVKNSVLFEKLTKAQLEAVTSVLCVEIYLHGDIIFEAGRTGSRLYIMKTGIAEIFAPTTGIVYAALETGTVFGEFGFFIPKATRLASARAVRSCQVLQLDKKKWNAAWPRDVREDIEAQLLPMVKARYVQSANTFMNISKNLFTKNEKAATSTDVMRVPVAKLAKRFSKVHPAPPSPPGNQREASIRQGGKSPKLLVSIQDVKPAERRSFTSETAALFKSTESQEANLRRRKTMIGRSNSRLGQLASELGKGNYIFLNGKKAEIPAQGPSPPSKPVEVATRVVATASNDLPELPQQEDEDKEQEIPTSKRSPPSKLARRRSSIPPARRRSSMTALAEALLGLKDVTGTKMPGSATPDTHVTAEISQVQTGNDGSEEETRDVFVQKVSSLTGPLEDPLLVPAANATENMGLPLASETKWRRHHKRLQGIMTFHAGSLMVQEAVQYDPEAQASRRHSISVVPSYYDHNISERVEHAYAREGFNRYYPVRRHSIHGNRKEMTAKLLAMDDFQNKLTVEVQIPPPPIRIPSPTVTFDKRRSISTFSSSSSRRFSSVSRGDTPSATTEELRPDLELERPWWRRVFGLSPSKKSKPKNKVVPLAAAVATASVKARIDKYQIWAPLPAVSPVFLGNSGFRQFWNVLMLVITLYYLFVIPFRMGFLHQYLSDATNVVTVEVWFLLEYVLTDSFCVVDFVLKRSYFVYLDHGQVVSDRKELAAHYWSRGSFVVDALSILPLEIFAVVGVYASTTNIAIADLQTMNPPQTLWHALSLLRINRFLRGVHLHSLTDKVQRFLLYDLKLSFMRPSILYLLRLALDFALGTHWVACLFFGISFLTYDDARPSWLTAPGMLLFEGCTSFYEVARVPVLVAYLRSLHFSIGAITTVCYGDILPLNAIENVVTLAVIFISVAFFSMLSGGFFKFFEHELGKRAEYEEKVAQVGHFMVFHQFPARTWKQMQVYFALSWQESKGMHEDHMLRGLTSTVRQDIALHVHANLMKHVKLFTHTDEQFARVVVSVLQHELFVRNDVIIQRGDMGRSLYIIETGLVSICVVRNLYGRASMAESTAEPAETHRSSVTEWIIPTAMPLAEAHRVAAVGALAGGLPGGAGGAPGDGGIPAATGAPMLVRDMAALFRGRVARKVTQREEKFVKGPFDYFGERSLLFGTPRNATCVALCVCSLFVLPVDRFEAILDEFPGYRSLCVKIWVMNRNLPTK